MLSTRTNFTLCIAVLLSISTSLVIGFTTVTPSRNRRSNLILTGSDSGGTNSKKYALNLFDKMFEEEGTLGKGITVGKMQVALISPDRSKSSIYGMLEDQAKKGGNESYELAQFANKVCLSLLRKKDSWTAATSASKWFGGDDWAKAEKYYNELANTEAAKFEKEYIPDDSSDDEGGGSTIVVVSLIVEIQGDETKFDRAGYSMLETQEVLSSIASDVVVDDGACVNAVEVFWTPSARDEVLSSRDIIIDFPELLTL